MLELIGFTTAFLVVGAIIVLALLSLAAPVAWLWMLVDAILRDDAEYPGLYANARLIWVLLIALLPVTAVVYFFAVYANARRGVAVAVQEPAPSAPVPSAPAPA